MRNFLLATFAAFAFLCSPAYASTCSIDKQAVDGDAVYIQCPKTDTNNELLNQGFNSARLETDIHLSETPIFAHNICRYTDARATTNPLFIPFNTAAEWESFVNNKPAGVDLAQCCTPRGMRTNDVPEPELSCFNDDGSEGIWRLTGLVDPTNTEVFLAKPASTQADAQLVLENGISENPEYPIIFMPIDRDDVASLLPRTASSEYVARFICSFGRKPVGFNSAPAVPSTGKGIKAIIGEVAFVNFKLQCRDGDWRTEECQPGQIGSLIEEACPNNATGKITKRLVLQCPSRAITEEIVSNTCAACEREELIRSETEACPVGESGLKTYDVFKVFFTSGDQCLSREDRRLKSNTCTACNDKPDEFLREEKEACATGQTGEKIYNVFKDFYLSGDQCLFTEKRVLVSNTCSHCSGVEPLPDETKACPAGQTGEKIFSVKKVYYIDPDTQQCKFTIVKTLKSNSCEACARTVDLADEKEACPSGQSGEKVFSVKKIFYSHLQ